MKFSLILLLNFICLPLLGQGKFGVDLFIQRNNETGTISGLGFNYLKNKSKIILGIGTQNYVAYEETTFIPKNSDITRQDSLPLLWSKKENSPPIFLNLGFLQNVFNLRPNVSFNVGLDIAYFQRQTKITTTLIGISADNGVMAADAKLATDYYFKRTEQISTVIKSISIPFLMDLGISNRCSFQIYTSIGYQFNKTSYQISRYQEAYMYLFSDLPEWTNKYDTKSNFIGSIYNYGISILYKL